MGFYGCASAEFCHLYCKLRHLRIVSKGIGFATGRCGRACREICAGLSAHPVGLGKRFFLWASYFWLGPVWVTPDLCVAVLVYLATGLLFRIRRGQGGWLVFAGLGVLLGLAYLAKSAMFPLAFVFLLSAFGLSRAARAALYVAIFRTLRSPGESCLGGKDLPLERGWCSCPQ
jgi:hypothetical protein